MKSSKVIPITKEFDKQQVIDAVCAEMTPIDTGKGKKKLQLAVETEGMATIISLKKGKKKRQSVKLVFTEKNCKVLVNWPYGVGVSNKFFVVYQVILWILFGIVFVVAGWIPVVLSTYIALFFYALAIYILCKVIASVKPFIEFQREIIELIKSYV